MPYLPVDFLNDTTFPKGSQRDFTLAVRVINERWRRHFPLLPYYRIKKLLTPAAPAALSGEPQTTQFDNLYGEAVASNMTTWAQPHLSGAFAVEVDQTDLFYPVVSVHARVRREARRLELQRWGFDKVRDLLVVVPSSLLDSAGIEVKVGDVILWNNERFNVLQYAGDGYWKNTNVPLYQVLNCQHRRAGS